MMFYTNTNNKGFSLVETLVAISILLLVVTGPMTISMRTAKSASFATEQVQAFFLAQEGLELAQKGRDDLLLRNFLPIGNSLRISNPWARFSSSVSPGVFLNCYTAGGCGLQWDSSNTTLSSPVACSVSCLLYRSASGRSRFTHTATGNVATPFTRQIYFTNVVVGTVTIAVQIRSEVTWRTGSLVAEQKVSTVTNLYNIYDLP